MKRIIIGIAIIHFVQIHAQIWQNSKSDTGNGFISESSTLDCSQYANDSEVLRDLPFNVPINPSDRDIHKTYAVSYSNGSIFVLSIANQTFIPPIIFCLQSLRYLFVRDSHFCQDANDDCQLSSDVERLESLESMSIIGTKVNFIPASFGKLGRLTILELMVTGLVTLPDGFGDLESLSSLTITYSRMTSLPMAIGMIRSLTNVYLDDNAALHSLQSLNGLPNLMRLSAINCSITRIPLNLPNIFYLYMSNNQLTNLNGIQTLGSETNNTKSFAFDMNQIQSLSGQIGSVYKLATLRINDNKLKNLPAEIYGVKTLIYLDIRKNLFTATRLEEIVAKFKITNPSLMLLY